MKNKECMIEMMSSIDLGNEYSEMEEWFYEKDKLMLEVLKITKDIVNNDITITSLFQLKYRMNKVYGNELKKRIKYFDLKLTDCYDVWDIEQMNWNKTIYNNKRVIRTNKLKHLIIVEEND